MVSATILKNSRHATKSDLEAAVREWFRHSGDRVRLSRKRLNDRID